MTTRNAKRPKVGDHAWLVSWCHELAFDDNGDVDHDRCKETEARVSTRKEAERLALQAWPVAEKTWGQVRYSEAVFTAYDDADALIFPHAGYWEEIGEPDYYIGE